MNGSYSSSPKKASATGRSASDPLATQDDPAKFLTQDTIISMPDQLLSVAPHGSAVSGCSVIVGGYRERGSPLGGGAGHRLGNCE
jgi:hypothetical protein